MTKTKKAPIFSRKLLAIPYALFLGIFVVMPLLIIVYYAFTDMDGAFTLENFKIFFSGSGGDSFFETAKQVEPFIFNVFFPVQMLSS